MDEPESPDAATSAEPTSQKPAPPPAPIPAPDDFGEAPAPRATSRAVMGVPIEVIISVGRARPMISELVELRRDSVLALDSKVEDPVEVFVGDRLIARGELQELTDGSGRLGVRLTDVADLSGGV